MVALQIFPNQCNKRPKQLWALSGLQRVWSAIIDTLDFAEPNGKYKYQPLFVGRYVRELFEAS